MGACAPRPPDVMKADFENIFQDIKNQSLSEAERVSMRNILKAHMAEHPATAPLLVRASDALASFADMFGSQAYTRMKILPAALSVVLVVGVGTAYAAEGALPGDPLYAIKVSLNEPLQGALALSDTSQASWHTKKIERRLAEAAALVAEGRMTGDAQIVLETDIVTSAKKFDETVEKLAARRGEAAVAAAQSDLEASLIGYAEVLLALTSQSDTGHDEITVPIIRTVIAKAEAAQSARAHSEASVVAQKDAARIRAAAIEKKNQAKEAILAVRVKASSALVATTSASEVATETAAAADVALKTAEQNLEKGDYGSAFSGFQEIIRTAKTVEVQLDTTRLLNTDTGLLTNVQPPAAGADAALMMSTELLD